VRERLTVHEADLFDAADAARAVAEAKPQLCVHAAWYAVPGRYLDAPENLEHVAATMRLAGLLRDAGCRRLVGLGTCLEYDTSLGTLSEQSATAPRHLYSVCKLSTFQILKAFAPLAKLSFAWCRIFFQYGPGEPPRRLVPDVIDRLLAGEVAEVTKGEQVRDFLHVDDVGAAVAHTALSTLEGAVNVGSGVGVTVREVVETAARLCDAADRVRYGAIGYREGDPMHVCANVEKLTQAGWRPRYGLEEGLRDTVQARREALRRG